MYVSLFIHRFIFKVRKALLEEDMDQVFVFFLLLFLASSSPQCLSPVLMVHILCLTPCLLFGYGSISVSPVRIWVHI
jgi:hypothetical protein